MHPRQILCMDKAGKILLCRHRARVDVSGALGKTFAAGTQFYHAGNGKLKVSKVKRSYVWFFVQGLG